MRFPAPATAILLVLLCIPPMVPADNDSTKVIVLVEQKDYAVGTSGNVTVLVFDRGIPVDPDLTPDVTILSAAPRGIPVFKYDKGLFIGNFTIKAGDVTAGTVAIEATATFGRSSDNDTVYNFDQNIATIYLAGPAGGASVSIGATRVSGSVPAPGATVTVESELTAQGSPVQPSGFGFAADFSDPDGVHHTEQFKSSTLAIGKYEGTYALPAVAYDLQLTLTASATYLNRTVSASTSLAFNQLCVVYHNVSKTPTGATFYLYAGDPSGRPVAGATFDFSYYPEGSPSNEKKAPTGTADAGGKARFALDFDAGARAIVVSGWANASGKSQRFTGTVDLSVLAPALAPPGTGFEMVFAGQDRFYTPGRSIDREYAAFNNSGPMKNQDIYTSIVAYPVVPGDPLAMTPTKLVQARPYTTDPSGRMTINFTPPSWDSTIFIYFKTATGIHPKPSGHFNNHDSNDGMLYSLTTDAVRVEQRYSGANVKVQASQYKSGAPTQVRATLGGGAPQTAFVSWIPGTFDPASPLGSTSSDWQVWSAIGSYMNGSTSGLSGSIVMPGFMPADIRYSAVVLITQKGALLPQFGSAALTPASTSSPTTESFPWTLLLLFVVVLAAVAAAAVGLALRSRRRVAAAASSGVRTTIKCPSCGTPITVLQGPEPVKVVCPNCGMTGTMPALPAAQAAGAPAQPQAAEAVGGAPPAPPLSSVAGGAAAGPAPQAALVRTVLPCPDCGTMFDVMRGPSPTKIQCPNCGKTGMLPGLSAEAMAATAPPQGAPAFQQPQQPGAMQLQMAAAAPPSTLPMQAQSAADMPVAESVTETRTIACPRCRQQFTIEKKEGPQHITCPHCGKEGTIGRQAAQPAAPSAAPAPQAHALPAPSPAPPARAVAQGRQRYAPAPAQRPAQQYPGGYSAPGAGPQAAGQLVTCPACGTRFPVSDPRRPIQVRCPSCGKVGTLRV